MKLVHLFASNYGWTKEEVGQLELRELGYLAHLIGQDMRNKAGLPF